jgi:hypothetical protein
MVHLKCKKQHASALLNKKSPLGKITLNKLAKSWGISPDDFYKEKTGQVVPLQEPSYHELLNKVVALEKRFDTFEQSTNLNLNLTMMGLESLKDSKKYIESLLASIDSRLEKAGESGDIRLLRRVG